ncbi:MAG TPA: polysaccharide biosynthesis protein [Bacteroidetes bacterium]|nr:polysaccharide biosynthesis protein [Bacteroidota bacterium]
MGIIKRQGIKNSIVNYFGVAIGAFNVLLIYPNAREAYGLIRFLMDTALLLTPFILLGVSSLTIRFFPIFKNEENGHNGFLFNLLGMAAIGMALFSFGFFLLQDKITELYKDKILIRQFIFYIVPFTCMVGLIELLTLYISNFHRIVVPALLNILIKITLPVLIWLYYHDKIGMMTIVQGVAANFLAVLVLLLAYLKYLGELNLRPNFSFLKKPLFRDMRTYAMYGILGLLGTMLAIKIDTIMIGTLLGEIDTGTYAILLFIANVIDIPRVALMKITSPIVSDASNNNDFAHLEGLYKKSSINLLMIGIFLFIGIFSNLDSLLDIMPNGDAFKPYTNIVLFVSLAKLVDMATSINNQIIGYSKYFRFNFYAVLFMAVFNIITNLIFIPKFNIVGAAMATFASITLYNLAKGAYVMYKFKMHPFTWNTLWATALGISVFFLALLTPAFGNPFADIIVRSLFILLVYGGTAFYFRLSTDINDIITGFIKKINTKIK